MWFVDSARYRRKEHRNIRGAILDRKALAQHHDTILDSINEGVFSIDMDWRITAFNRAAERITGIKRRNAIGLHCSEVFRTNICENACALKRTMTTGRPTVNAVAYIINEDGRRVPIRISTALLKDSRGKIVGGVETFQDMTLFEELRKELEERYCFEDIIGRSSAMKELFQILPQIAESDSTVLIEGASGTGKELFARAVHNLSPRSKKRFVAINCAALPDALLESELFGYKAGAFTDAKREKPGRFAEADGGTLFLDEIGDISPALQVRLLRVLQEHRIEPLGALKSIKVDVRIVAATNKNLSDLLQAGTFREDLFYRIHVIYLQIPDLRKRREDIPLLINHLVAKFNRRQGKNVGGVSEEVLKILMSHAYPGNVRELENIIEYAFVLCRGVLIKRNHLPQELLHSEESSAFSQIQPVTFKKTEKLMIEEALIRHAGNRRRVAEELGINPSTLYRKIKSLQIDAPLTDGRTRNKLGGKGKRL